LLVNSTAAASDGWFQRCVLQSRFHALLHWPSVLQTGSARRVGEMIQAIKLLSTEPITWKFSEHNSVFHYLSDGRSPIRAG
jgi:hypothetical protein